LVEAVASEVAVILEVRSEEAADIQEVAVEVTSEVADDWLIINNV